MTSASTRSTVRGVRTTLTGLAVLLAAGCTGTKEAPDSEVVTATVRIELPPGFVAKLDDREDPLGPDEDHGVLAGPHTVVVTTPCGSHTAKVDLVAGSRVVLGKDDFAGLRFVSLKVRATDLEGKPLQPRITLDEWLVPGAASRGASVPACKARMKVSAPELGAFIEDVDLTGGKALKRSVVLTPGSDVVRIHGGPLKFHDWRLFPDATDERGNPIGLGDSYDHTLATFDMDQREVTTAEFHACRVDGACTDSFQQRMTTAHPLERETPLCTTGVIDPLRAPLPDRREVAMNCVVLREAEEYCRWLGKRLPDVEEWEFAARSRGDDSQWLANYNLCSDSYQDDALCPLKAQTKPGPPCALNPTDTAQGLCDMFGNLSELTVPTSRSWPDVQPAGRSYVGWPQPWGLEPDGEERQSSKTGFRCARSVPG